MKVIGQKMTSSGHVTTALIETGGKVASTNIAHELIMARAEAYLPVRVCFQYDSFDGIIQKNLDGRFVFTAQGMKDVNLSFILNLESVFKVEASPHAFRIYMKVDLGDGSRLPFH